MTRPVSCDPSAEQSDPIGVRYNFDTSKGSQRLTVTVAHGEVEDS